ncbi:MAG: NAD(P)-binding domain-containing protein [Ilumatobacteraceae bacterium]
MRTVDTVVIGAGQAGLAMSHCLTARGRDHVVLERGRLAERWRSERWDSMRLLSPNWMTRLPGWSYDGAEPDGFMTAAEVVDHFVRYASAAEAPVEPNHPVVALRRDGEGFRIVTANGTWAAANVVIATGWCDRPAVPDSARSLSAELHQITPDVYRNPSGLPAGGVLVVGASATGVQLAAELRTAGRDVVLAVGSHTRLPRTYRGMDVLWWLDRLGKFDVTIDQVSDGTRARREPSMQLAAGRSLDLPILRSIGVGLAGRMTDVDGARVTFADDLAVNTTAADRRLRRVLTEIDDRIEADGLSSEVLDPDPPVALRPGPVLDHLDLRDRGIGTVLWATGHRRSYPWLEIPVVDAAGEIRQRHGVTPCPGLYTLGQRFQHRRGSNFIDGVGRDAELVANHLLTRADRRVATHLTEAS